MNARRRRAQKSRAREARLLRIEQDIFGVAGIGERFRQRRIVWAKLDNTPLRRGKRGTDGRRPAY